MSKLPPKEDLQIKHRVQIDLRFKEISTMMMEAAKHCIRYVRLPRDERFIKEIREVLELDGYTVRREYIRVDMSSSGWMGPGDEFVGWIISWLLQRVAQIGEQNHDYCSRNAC